MIAEPKSFRCTLLIKEIQADPKTPDKYIVWGKILAVEERSKGNVFFSPEREIKGFTFNIPLEVKRETKVTADVEFMGSPLSQNYRLSSIKVIQ